MTEKVSKFTWITLPSESYFSIPQPYWTDLGFILVKIPKARQLYEYLLSQGIIVRDRSALELCEDSLRITVGTEQENTLLVDAMYQWITNTFELTLN